MKISLEIPDYFPEKGIETAWEPGFIVSTEVNERREMVISANREGLISLARHLLTLAQPNVPAWSHIHYSDYGSLEADSPELIIQRSPDSPLQ